VINKDNFSFFIPCSSFICIDNFNCDNARVALFVEESLAARLKHGRWSVDDKDVEIYG